MISICMLFNYLENDFKKKNVFHPICDGNYIFS